MELNLPRHPARYTDSLLPVFAEIIPPNSYGLDPFGGTGKIYELGKLVDGLSIECLEIEPEWARYDSRITVGNALDMPWAEATFDWICTSPTYANRMADHHEAKDSSRRNTYRHALGRPLNACNSGQMQWGLEYQRFHVAAWIEAHRVLKPGGVFILNIKDHIRGGRRVRVSRWHHETLKEVGFLPMGIKPVRCPGNRYGQNGKSRISYELVLWYRKGCA